jgi:hypothetical protein
MFRVAVCVMVAVAGPAWGGYPKQPYRSYLAIGPAEIEVIDGQGKKRAGRLVVIAPEMIVWTRSDMRAPMTQTAKSGNVREVRFAESAAKANYVLEGSFFEGPANIAPAYLRERPRRLSTERPVTDQYLAYALVRLAERAEVAVSRPGVAAKDLKTDPAVEECRRYVAGVMDVIRRGDHDRALLAAYDDVPTQIDRRIALVREWEVALQEARQEHERLVRKAAAEESRGAARVWMGLLGILTSNEREEWRDGDIIYSRDRTNQAQLFEGVAQAARGYLEIELAREGLAAGRDRLRAELMRKLAENLEEREAIRVRLLRQGWQAVARSRKAGARLVADRLRQRGEWLRPDNLPRILATAEERLAAEPENPFAVADKARAVILQTEPAATGEALLVQAMEVAETVRWVPTGKEFDLDRADVLHAAAAVSYEGLEREAGPTGHWAVSHHPYARFTTLLLDEALNLGVSDGTGNLRELRAWSLFRAGELDQAYEQSKEIAGLRQTSARYHFNHARLAAALGKTRESLDGLETAIKNGFSRLGAIRNVPEFKDLRGMPRFEKLTKHRCEARLDRGRFVVTNSNSFPVTNVRVRIDYAVRNAGGGV